MTLFYLHVLITNFTVLLIQYYLTSANIAALLGFIPPVRGCTETVDYVDNVLSSSIDDIFIVFNTFL